MTKFYNIPDEFYHRIHFVRPRFKSNIENVLFYMANECCDIDECPSKEYKARYNNAIKLFPGNIGKKQKTYDNWRTEIPALFAFYEEDKEKGTTRTSRMARFLSERQDLTQFFKQFLNTFQFPGGHVKPHEMPEMIEKGVRFKPAKLILLVLMEGNKILREAGSDKAMSITKQEATFCIFNDIRCTTGKKSPKEIAETILENRRNKLQYIDRTDLRNFSSKGICRTNCDIVRYAGDVLDYMVTASLLECSHGYFTLNEVEHKSIDIIAQDDSFFTGYDHLLGKKNVTPKQLAAIEGDWFAYVNSNLSEDKFKTDISTLFAKDDELEVVVDERIHSLIHSDETTTTDIGNIGEAIICGHEKMRLKLSGYEQFVKFVRIVDKANHHPGFDIESYEGDGTNKMRMIEAKTTISRKKIEMYNFHMSDHEWNVADTIGEHYCVYRLMLSLSDKMLYVLRDPVELYRAKKVTAKSRNGMDVAFNPESFTPTPLLIWKD